MAYLLTGTLHAVVITGSVTTFNGPDQLFLNPATNIIAVNSYGSTASQVINGVTFVTDGTGTGPAAVSSGGVTVTTTSASNNAINNWGSPAPSYTGANATSANNLEDVMHDIRWSNAGNGDMSIVISGLTNGTLYNIQLLMSEHNNGFDRHYDIAVDGVLVVDDYTTNITTNTLGSVYSGNFDPGADGTLNILMGRNPIPLDPNNTPFNGSDNNAVIQGIVVHQIPEPSSFMLLGLGLTGLLMRRRKS